MTLLNVFVVLLGLIGAVNAEDKAEVNIRVSGQCSPVYLSRRGIELSKYRPLIRFNPDKIQLIPKNPVIPGCVKIKAEGVEILKPIRNLIAEVEMRIGGTPDPNNPTLPCSKKIDDKVNQCPCAKTEGSCVFCDFCRQMKSQTSRISVTESPLNKKTESLDESCKCDVMQPGLYDIETEMCTPELDDAKQYIPPEIQNNILEKTPISMFITVYLMDMAPNPNESYLSAFGKAILQRRMAQSTVACFLMGLDIIEWLELPDDERPYFLGVYFEQPDGVGHNNGTDTDTIQTALINIDAMVNYLLSRLDRKGYLGCVNIVLLSDHGMQKLRTENAKMEDYIDINDENIIATDGVISHLYWKDKTNLNITEKIAPFRCKKGEYYYVHTPDTLPKRYHYASTPRVGDVILESSVGHIMYKNKQREEKSTLRGDHGYDFALKPMRAIFGAYGPSVKKNLEIAPFQNVELYNLFVDLMQLPIAAPNNGTRGSLYNILKNPPTYENGPQIDLPECFGVSLVNCGDGCHFKIQTEEEEKQACNRLDRMQVPEEWADSATLCTIGICNATLVYDQDLGQAKFVESLLKAEIPHIDHRASCTVHLKFSNKVKMDHEDDENPQSRILSTPIIPTVSNCSKGMTLTSNTSWITLFNDNDYSRYLAEGQISAPIGFIKGIWNDFLALLKKYQRHYKNLVMFAGPIYDVDHNGLRDSTEQIVNVAKKQPTHVFIILLRCKGSWHRSGRYCEDSKATRVLSFLLPLLDSDLNCLQPLEYLYRHTCRVRDIELLTGLEWFTNRAVYDDELALRLRTQQNEELWQMEHP
uniref:Venom phosphodiesterase 2 n=1 Tax=Bursaphelenchus xylophilus TaxID=6326 RepID=A0A1I7RSU5_BURXY